MSKAVRFSSLHVSKPPMSEARRLQVHGTIEPFDWERKERREMLHFLWVAPLIGLAVVGVSVIAP